MKQKGFNKIRYYFKVWYSITKQSLSKASTYKVEVIARALRGIFLVVTQIIFINAVIGNNSTFVGWTREELYLLAGVFNIINYISWSVFSINLWRLEEKILKGEFDFILLKPFSSIFGASFTEFFIDDAVSAISGFILVGYYVFNNLESITLINSLMFIITILAAFVVWFSFELMFASFDFIKPKNGMREIKKQLVGIGKFPTEIWQGNVRYIFYTILPIAFVGAVPAKIIIGDIGWNYVLIALLISLVTLMTARFIWNWALKRYTSAG